MANGAWDNIHRPDEFLDWVRRVAEVALVVNSPAVLGWNLDKRYLAALSEAGVATVPTTWLAPGQFPVEHELALPPGEFVVKPAVSGGGFETARYGGGGGDGGGGGGEVDRHGQNARAHIRRLLNAGRTVMIQPYQAAVDTHGEAGLIFLGGRYSHAIGKGPLLRPGAGPQTHLHHHEQIVGPTTYARVDLVNLADGAPAVLELELLDPALFFETRPAAATRFAQVLRALIP